jgi:hypothetical protein
MENTYLTRTLQCWNSPLVIEAGKFAHLTARARWIDGRCLITATVVAVRAPMELCGVNVTDYVSADVDYPKIVFDAESKLSDNGKVSHRGQFLLEFADTKAVIAGEIKHLYQPCS